MTEHRTEKTNDGQQATQSANFAIVQVAEERQRIGRRLTAVFWLNSWLVRVRVGGRYGSATRAMAVLMLLAFMETATPTRYIYHLRRI